MSLSRLMRLVYTPRGSASIAAHVKQVYGVDVRGVAQLDMGVYYTKTVTGRAPSGDEWWLRRATVRDPQIGEVMHAAFG